MNSGVQLIFDTETSGLGSLDRPIELGYIRIDSGLEILAHSALLRSVEQIDAKASEINGITMERIGAEGKDPKDELQRFFAVVREVLEDGGVLVAHNAEFDVKMLARLAGDVGTAV